MRIDAHQHFWQLSQPFDYGWLEAATHAPIRKDFLPADLAPHLAAANLDGSIFVQTQHDVAENRWVLKLAEENPFVVGVVGWVNLAGPEFRGNPVFDASHASVAFLEQPGR